MFQFLSKKIPLWRSAFSCSFNQDRSFLQLQSFSAISKTNPKSNEIVEDDDKRLFIINYLKQAYGLSQQKAESASRYLTFNNLQKPDSVISFFKNQGFSSTQISNLIFHCPRMLGLNPDNTLLPKFEFFRSLGLSNKDIVLMICNSNRSCQILERSLEKQIIPLYTYLSTLLESHENTLVCIKRFCLILSLDLENVLIPNVECLSEVGVPRVNVVGFVRNYPIAFSYKHDRFWRAVNEVISMGFNPMKAKFCAGVFVFSWNNESLWREKMGVYKSVGLCDDEIIEAFQWNPYCMIYSADKIFKTMDFLVNRMGFEPSFVMTCPRVVSFSLEKTIIPRCMVYKALLAQDLVPKKFSLNLLLYGPEKKFLSTFVEPFEAQVPGLLLMYYCNKSRQDPSAQD